MIWSWTTFICEASHQLSPDTSAVAELLVPLCPLVSTKNEFIWTEDHDQAVVKAKESLTATLVLAFFDLAKAYTIVHRLSAGKAWDLLCNSKEEMVNGT